MIIVEILENGAIFVADFFGDARRRDFESGRCRLHTVPGSAAIEAEVVRVSGRALVERVAAQPAGHDGRAGPAARRPAVAARFRRARGMNSADGSKAKRDPPDVTARIDPKHASEYAFGNPDPELRGRSHGRSCSPKPADLRRCRSKPVFSGVLPWTGTERRTTLPSLP